MINRIDLLARSMRGEGGKDGLNEPKKNSHDRP